jgi:shikimate kinase
MRNLLKKPIVIVGMMGSGKSTVGKRLAHRLNLQFYDSDKMIEEREGLSVMEIYDYRGEEYFKQQEIKIISEILNYGIVVISTGGRSLLIEEIRNSVKDNAITVWLKANLETLHERVSRRNTRPHLSGVNKYETIQKLLEECEPIYRESDIIVESKDMEAHFVVDTILSKLKTFLES